MARNAGIYKRDELDSRTLRRDSRPFYIRFSDWCTDPDNQIILLGVIGALVVIVPALVFPASFVILMGYLLHSGKRPRMPVRVPLAANTTDYSQPVPETRNKFEKGEGIMYLGYDRGEDGSRQHVYSSNSDARQHKFVLGTTGSGKTQALLSWAFNTLSWGSGYIYIDGKGDNELIFQSYSMQRRLGLEDNWFVLNFNNGDIDAFEIQRNRNRLSNTVNPFASYSANSLTQLVSSLMPESGGDNAMWQGLAIGMVGAVINGLCYKRFVDGFTIDAGVLRDNIELSQLIRLTKEFQERPDVPRDLVVKPLQVYLLNLPGFDWELNLVNGEPVSEDTKKQHDFRSMQFLRQLTMLADTYGAVFRAQIPEVDMLDIVLKRRTCIVIIPSLGKSEEESQGVGKLIVSSLRMMMSKTLGAGAEGEYDREVASRPTKSRSPYMAIFDELGYYFTKGLAAMFAQARGLGFSLIAAGQDLSALWKGSFREEAESVFANTRFKITLALEDPEKTADVVIKSFGKAMVSEVAGYEGKMGAVTSSVYKDNLNATIQERSRVTLEELKDMESGQSILGWRDRVIRMQNFYVFAGPGKIEQSPKHSLNKLVSCFPPGASEISPYCKELPKKKVEPLRRVLSLLTTPILTPSYSGQTDDISDDLLYEAIVDIDIERNFGGMEIELGIYYRFQDGFSETEQGTVKRKKGSLKGPSLVPGSTLELESIELKPVVEEINRVFNFDEIFADSDGVPLYPVKPKLDYNTLKLEFESATPELSEHAWRLDLDDTTKQHVQILDGLLDAKTRSEDSIQRTVKYAPRRDLASPRLADEPNRRIDSTRGGF